MYVEKGVIIIVSDSSINKNLTVFLFTNNKKQLLLLIQTR